MKRYLLILTHLIFSCYATHQGRTSLASSELIGTLYSAALPDSKSIQIFIPEGRKDNEAYVSCDHKPFSRTTSDTALLVPITFWNTMRMPFPGSDQALYHQWSWAPSERSFLIRMRIASAVMSTTEIRVRKKLLYCIDRYTTERCIGIKKIANLISAPIEQLDYMVER